VRVMKTVCQVVVFDAADLHAESAFWAGMLGGHVFEDDEWHSVIDAAGEWRIGVQLAPNHIPPDWPHGAPSRCISTSTSTTRGPRMKTRWPSAPGCSSQLLISMLPSVTGYTRTRPGIRFASAGDSHPERRSRRSSPTAWDGKSRAGARRARSGPCTVIVGRRRSWRPLSAYRPQTVEPPTFRFSGWCIGLTGLTASGSGDRGS